MISDLSPRTLLHDAWSAVTGDRLDDALALYGEVIGLAPSDGPELRTALLGAWRVHRLQGEAEQADLYARELSRIRPREQLHPKQRQLFVPAEDLLQMPYLREIQFSGSTPGRFNPLAHHFGSQKVIAAAVWEQRPRADAAGRIWEARLYWLKDYDPPFCYRYYTGGDSRPCEAVDPITVLEAVEFPVCEMQQCEGDAR